MQFQKALCSLLLGLTLSAPGRIMPEPGLGWVVSDLEEPWIPSPTSPPGVQPKANCPVPSPLLHPLKPGKNMTYFCGYML